MSLTSNISVASVGFSTTGLRFTYQSSANEFTLGGRANATVGGIGNMDVSTSPGNCTQSRAFIAQMAA
jgi:hypothetical protein